MNPPKKYGLLHLKTSNTNKGLVRKPSIFGNDSDEEDTQAAVNQMINRESTKTKLKRQTQMQIEDALTQDPTVYEYDAVYDTFHPDEQKKKSKKPEDRKSKYIGSLMHAAEERKKEYERRVERQVQREREAEGGMYGDKEEFVTDAYRRKMAERQEEEERERRQEQMEALLDVKKQSSLTGFYRHLLNQTTGEEAIPQGTTSSIAQLKVKLHSESEPVEVKKEEPEDEDRDLSSSASSSDNDDIKQTQLPSGGVGQHHKRDQQHGRHHRKHDDRDDTRRKPDDHDRDDTGDSNRRKTESGHTHREHNGNDDTSSSRDKASEANASDKHGDKPLDSSSKRTEKTKSQTSKFARHNVGECVEDAKARYLARKHALKAAVVKEND